jgi:hypothetical protein
MVQLSQTGHDWIHSVRMNGSSLQFAAKSSYGMSLKRLIWLAGGILEE